MIDNLGSVIFNLAYLGTIWAAIVIVLVKAPAEKTPEWKWVFGAFLLLGFGDIFHLVTRTIVFVAGLQYADPAAIYAEQATIYLLGVGLVMTSITVQVFYLGMYMYWRAGEVRRLEAMNKTEEDPRLFKLDITAVAATIFRVVLIMYPQNRWGAQVEGYNLVRLLTNVPLYVIGIECLVLFYQRARATGHDDIPGFAPADRKMVKNSAHWILVSYACYSLTLFLSPVNAYFGMAMIPKTVAYLVVLWYFYKGLLVAD